LENNIELIVCRILACQQNNIGNTSNYDCGHDCVRIFEITVALWPRIIPKPSIMAAGTVVSQYLKSCYLLWLEAGKNIDCT